MGDVPVSAASGTAPGLLNVANILTVVRILLVPVFVACLFAGGTGWRLAALAAFCVASLTDFVDGRLARSRGLVTDFGKIADPIADKALTGAALISLTVLGELPGWVTAPAPCSASPSTTWCVQVRSGDRSPSPEITSTPAP